jgi:hypothetical protein
MKIDRRLALSLVIRGEGEEED